MSTLQTATLSHWRAAASSWGWGRPVSIGRLAQAAVGQTEEVEFLCLFERQTEIERLQETQRSAAGRYEAEKPGSEGVCVYVCVAEHKHI